MADAALPRPWRLEKAERFLQASQRAFQAGDWETCVSRAYYATFHAVIALLETRTALDVPRRHVQLHNLLRSPLFPPLLDRDAVADIYQLYQRRQSADYESSELDAGLAQESLSMARAAYERIVQLVIDA